MATDPKKVRSKWRQGHFYVTLRGFSRLFADRKLIDDLCEFICQSECLQQVKKGRKDKNADLENFDMAKELQDLEEPIVEVPQQKKQDSKIVKVKHFPSPTSSTEKDE
jgi:hypothetical protein